MSVVAWLQPPHLRQDEYAIEVTFTEPAGAVVRFLQPLKVDSKVAAWLAEPLLSSVRRRFPQADSLCFVHDWSMATGYDVQARVSLTQWAVEHRQLLKRTYIISPEGEGRIMRIGVTTAALTLRPFGVRIELVPDLPRALELSGQRRADGVPG
jgi:hypothetical protein